MGVLVDLREVELRRVPAADAVVRAEVPGDGVAVGLGLVPLGEEEHVLAVLVREPRDGHRGVQGLVLSAHKTNFTNAMAMSRHRDGWNVVCTFVGYIQHFAQLLV